MVVNKDYSISVIRLFAMISIIACHMFQYFDNALCDWLNVGVQIFLCISGYLYGTRIKPESSSKYICKRFFRIYPEYLFVVVVAIILYFLFHSDYISLWLGLKMIICYDTVIGGGHLWYIPTILLCSLLSIFYWDIFTEKKKDKDIIVSFLMVFFIQILLFESFFSYFNSAKINCFFIGFIIGFFHRAQKERIYKIFISIILLLTVLTNSIQLIIELIYGSSVFSGILLGCYHRFCDYAHLLLGISLFVLIKLFFVNNNLENTLFKTRKLLDFTDSISYEVYLIHQFIILGPFSMMSITNYLFVNILIIMLIVLFVSYLLNRAYSMIQKQISRIITKQITQ